MNKLNMKHISCLLYFVMFSYFCMGQPFIEWQKCMGGSSDDFANVVKQTKDGGYIIAGNVYSNDGDITGFHKGVGPDIWIVRLHENGKILWQKTMGGTSSERPAALAETKEGHIYVLASARSKDGDLRPFMNGSNEFIWILKFDASGNCINKIQMGGSKNEEAKAMHLTNDGGLIIACSSESNDGDVKLNYGDKDFWIVKLDSKNKIEWQKTIGGKGYDVPTTIKQTKDGYIVAGFSNSYDGDFLSNLGGMDCWIIKLNNDGEIEWKKSFGGSSHDKLTSMDVCSDGSFIFAGTTKSTDKNIIKNNGEEDFFIIKLNFCGNTQWINTYGGSHSDMAQSIQQTNDKGFIVTGYTLSNDGDVNSNNGKTDYWLLKLDAHGKTEWQKCIGGTQNDYLNHIQITKDKGFILAGYSNSSDADVKCTTNKYDFWIVKLKNEK